MSKPIIIKGPLPGQAVDEHLKKFGHLPVTDLCDREGTCVRKLPELVKRIAELEAELETSNAHHAASAMLKVRHKEQMEVRIRELEMELADKTREDSMQIRHIGWCEEKIKELEHRIAVILGESPCTT